MEVAFDEVALEDLSFWKDSGNLAVQTKIANLISAIKHPHILELENLKP